MAEDISIIREAGFFKKYQTLTEEQLLNTLYEIQRELYTERFGYNYAPERKNDLYSIARQDHEKFLDIDLEADVCNGNNVYQSLLEEFSKASNNLFLPSEISETWNSDVGPIKLSFISNGQPVLFEPVYMDDWIDESVFEIINEEMRKVSNELFYLCSGPNNDWLGQNEIYIRLTANEKTLLEEKLGWNFC